MLLCNIIIISLSQAVSRTSKPYYTILAGAKLHFYKDRKDVASVSRIHLCPQFSLYVPCREMKLPRPST